MKTRLANIIKQLVAVVEQAISVAEALAAEVGGAAVEALVVVEAQLLKI